MGQINFNDFDPKRIEREVAGAKRAAGVLTRKQRRDQAKEIAQGSPLKMAAEQFGNPLGDVSGKVPKSRTQRRQDTPGTIEAAMARYDQARFGERKYGVVTDSDRQNFEEALRFHMKDGAIPPGKWAQMLDTLEKRKGTGVIGTAGELRENPEINDDPATIAADTLKLTRDIPVQIGAAVASSPFREPLGENHPVTKGAEFAGGIVGGGMSGAGELAGAVSLAEGAADSPERGLQELGMNLAPLAVAYALKIGGGAVKSIRQALQSYKEAHPSVAGDVDKLLADPNIESIGDSIEFKSKTDELVDRQKFTDDLLTKETPMVTEPLDVPVTVRAKAVGANREVPETSVSSPAAEPTTIRSETLASMPRAERRSLRSQSSPEPSNPSTSAKDTVQPVKSVDAKPNSSEVRSGVEPGPVLRSADDRSRVGTDGRVQEGGSRGTAKSSEIQPDPEVRSGQSTGLANQVQSPEGIAQADVAKEREGLGLEPYRKTRYKVSDYSQEAIDRGHAKNALAIADQINAKKKTSADRFEQEGLRLGKHDLKVRIVDAERAKSDAVESGDAFKMAEADSMRETALGEYDRISRALDTVGSEAGGTLGARQYELVNESDALTLRQKVQSETGAKVSPAQQESLDAAAAKVKQLEERVAELEKTASPLMASRALRSPRSVNRSARVTGEQAKQAVAKLTTVVKPGALGSGLGGIEINWTQEHADALRTVVRYVVQNTPGLRNLEDPLEGLKAKVQEHLGFDPGNDRLTRAVVDELGNPRDVSRQVLRTRAQENAARRQARQLVDEIVAEAKWRQKTGWQQAATHVTSVVSAPRRLMTFGDISAVGRQGLRLALTHPKAAAKAFVRQWEVIKKDGFDAVMGRLEADPDYDLYKGAGGYIADPRMGVREEGFLGSFLDKIPGLNVAMSKSEDLMAAYLNELRIESFKALKGGLSIGGKPATTKELQWAADMVNVASGRGLKRSGPEFSQVFFSPQLLVSRLQLATGAPVVKGFRASRRAGAVASAEYAKYIGARAVLGTLMAAAGFKTTFDIHDKEFGDARRKKLKVDMSGGEDAAVKLIWGNIAKGVENTVLTARGEKLQEADYGKDFASDVGRFFSNRTAPVAGFIKGMIDGKDFKGDTFDPKAEAVKLIAPINASNLVRAKKDGASNNEMYAIAVLDGLGFSTGYYPEPVVKPKTAASATRKSRKSASSRS